jgi:hypothetical protein
VVCKHRPDFLVRLKSSHLLVLETKGQDSSATFLLGSWSTVSLAPVQNTDNDNIVLYLKNRSPGANPQAEPALPLACKSADISLACFREAVQGGHDTAPAFLR